MRVQLRWCKLSALSELLKIITLLISFFVASYFIYYLRINYSFLKHSSSNDCGVILFRHIPKTGGGSFVQWLSKHAPVFHMFNGTENDEKLNDEMNSKMWKSIIPTANKFVGNTSSKVGWKAVHLHHNSPGMYYNHDLIQSWKAIVEERGCVFHTTTILRDPLDRFISSINYNKTPLDRVYEVMKVEKNFLSRYFLFGTCGYQWGNELKCKNSLNFIKSIPNMTERDVKELMKIIADFDSIGFLDNYDEYLENIRNVTGWKDDVVTRENNEKVHKSKDYFQLTSNILKTFLDLNQEDYVFYYYMKNKRNKFIN